MFKVLTTQSSVGEVISKLPLPILRRSAVPLLVYMEQRSAGLPALASTVPLFVKVPMIVRSPPSVRVPELSTTPVNEQLLPTVRVPELLMVVNERLVEAGMVAWAPETMVRMAQPVGMAEETVEGQEPVTPEGMAGS